MWGVGLRQLIPAEDEESDPTWKSADVRALSVYSRVRTPVCGSSEVSRQAGDFGQVLGRCDCIESAESSLKSKKLQNVGA
jgi:hypothetical protein